MERIEFNKLFKIEKERLLSNYQRINRMFKNLNPTDIIAKFLINQSVGFSPNSIIEILNYYKPKIREGKTLLDLAIEWIRANRIRVDYKKFINLGTYEDQKSAIDDIIFLFFLDYDKHIRELLIKKISEREICALYEIFFNPNQVDYTNIDTFLRKKEYRVHTIFKGEEKVNTNIFTLREGLSAMIKKDYSELNSSKVEIKSDQQKLENDPLSPINEFDGSMLERLIKSYRYTKQKIIERELENSISRFLSSFFKFGQFYNYEDFKDELTQNLIDSWYSGIEKIPNDSSLNIFISDNLLNFENTIEKQKLDGLAWIKDLTPVLKDIIIRIIDML
ncbi:MAG: hypothetical protein ACFE94_16450 [Candidatus Hodarchaeota archaeon]